MSDYRPGLEGITAGVTSISCIDEEGAGLLYRGYAVDDLADRASFEEVAYLLLKGSIPSEHELDKFKRQIANNAHLPSPLVDIMRQFPRDGHAMDILRTSVSALGMFDPDSSINDPEANQRKAIRLLAQMPTIVALGHRIRQHKSAIWPQHGLPLIDDFFSMLGMQRPDELVKKVFGVSLILYAEHEFNNSTFAARTVASTLTDMHSAVTAAIGALKGPLHGGANEAVMRMLLDIAEPGRVEPWLHERLLKKERIMGFGHRIYKQKEDSRSAVIKRYNRMLVEHSGNMQWFEMSERLEDMMLKEKGLYPNLDFYTASAYYLMGLPIDLYTPIFVMSRITGWCAHIMEQQANNRLVRPSSQYIGPKGLKYGS